MRRISCFAVTRYDFALLKKNEPILGAQHALGLDHQRLDIVARLAAFAFLDLGELFLCAPVVDGFDLAAQFLVGGGERIPRGDKTRMQALPLAILSSL